MLDRLARLLPRAPLGYVGAQQVTQSNEFRRFMDALDRQSEQLTQGGAVAAGTVQMFGGSVAPPGFLLCDGTRYETRAHPTLFAAIGYRFGGSGSRFAVPDLVNFLPIGAGSLVGLGATSGAATVKLEIANLPAHSHDNEEHTHGMPSVAVTENTPHTHPAVVTDPTHSHSAPVRAASADVMAGTDKHSADPPGTTGAASTGVTVAVNASADLDMQTAEGTTGGATTATGETGGGAAFSILPPVLGVTFIIKT